jgi:hypothetical protein
MRHSYSCRTRTIPSSADPGSHGVSGVTCAKCIGTSLKLEYRFNFFLRCSDCRGATPLVLSCGRCGTVHKDIKKPDTFRDRAVWSIKCRQCEQSVPVEGPLAVVSADLAAVTQRR